MDLFESILCFAEATIICCAYVQKREVSGGTIFTSLHSRMRVCVRVCLCTHMCYFSVF